MRLFLDIGNTTLRWAPIENGVLGPVSALRHGGGMPLDLLSVWEALEPPDEIVASNVAGPDLATALTRVTLAYWGGTPRFPTPIDSLGGLRLAYADPRRLGVDRWLALLAARRWSDPGEALVIVDAGTAATLDLLTADGEHLGGLILPGLGMMRDGLTARTQLDRFEAAYRGVPAADQVRLGGRDTHDAMAAGGPQAIAALTWRLRERLSAATGCPVAILVTGGDADTVASHLERPCRIVPDLVLRGLLQLSILESAG